MKNLLNKYEKNIYSQSGEDGVIEHIFSIIPNSNKWCVEFGAWDGIVYSNTRALIEKGWNAVLIEPNPRKFISLKKNNSKYPKAICLKKFINLSGKNSLDNILKDEKAPKSIDLLSIDIDGNDYHIWKSLNIFKPKVVVIEFNQTIPPDIEYVQACDFSVRQGNSLKSLQLLAKEKKYELICCTEGNAFFVQEKYFPLFKIKNNSIKKLWNYEYETKLYQLFDGTIKITGNNNPNKEICQK